MNWVSVSWKNDRVPVWLLDVLDTMDMHADDSVFVDATNEKMRIECKKEQVNE